MAAITAVPTPHTKPVKFGNYAVDMTFICSVKVSAGQAVGLNAAGKLVVPAAGAAAIGAALYAGEAEDEIAVRLNGVVAMFNGDGSTAIAPGASVAVGAFGGVVAGIANHIGISLEAIPGGAFGYVLLAQKAGA